MCSFKKKTELEIHSIISFLNTSVNTMDPAIVKLVTSEIEFCNKKFTDRQQWQV